MYRESAYQVDEDSFSSRLTHNFRTQLLLCLKGKNWTRDDILRKTYQLPGYKCHKVVRYGYKWSHIHIKFEEEFQALAAINELASVNSGLAAVLVDDLLREWYNFETKFGHGPTWTITVVDIVGHIPHCLNFLTESLLSYLFQDFGNPYLLPYTAALNEVHVQMAFHSMTEALAACMAFGQWYRMNVKLDIFCYRVRINPAQREAFLIQNCGGNSDEAFMLDYFINVRNDVMQSREANGWGNNQNENGNYLVNSPRAREWNNQETFQNPGANEFGTNRWSQKQVRIPQNISRHALAPQKMRKHRHQQVGMEHQSHVAFQRRTPLLCVPIITPVTSAYAQALMSTGQISADFTNTIMNFPKAYAEAHEPDDDGNFNEENKMLPCSTIVEEIPEMPSCSNEVSNRAVLTENHVIPTEKDISNDLNRAPDLDRSAQSSKHPQKTAKAKKYMSKRSSRVFERRDVLKQKARYT